MKLTKTSSGKNTVNLSRKEWEKIGKQAGWFNRNQAPAEGEFGHGLNEEAMKLLKSYGITQDRLFEFDTQTSNFQDIYQGIQAAKQGNNEALRQALEARFGKKNFLNRQR